MQLTNDFRVDADQRTVWRALTDLERIAPLVPGAQLHEVQGSDHRGIVRLKVGPLQAQYRGTAALVDADEAGGRLVLRAAGRDTGERSAGDATAIITVTLAPDGPGTRVRAATDLTTTGKVAQFGRGVLMDVSTRLIGQFADNLQKELHTVSSSEPTPTPTSGAGAPATNGAVGGPSATNPEEPVTSDSVNEPAPDSPTSEAPRRVSSPEPEPVDLFEAAGNPMLKRLVPLAGTLVVVVALVVVRRRRKASRLDAVRSRIPADLPDLADAEKLVGQARQLSKKAAKKAAKKANKRAASAGRLANDAAGVAAEVVKSGRHVVEEAAEEGGKRAKKAQKRAAKRARKASTKANLVAGSAAGTATGLAAGVADSTKAVAGRASRRVAHSAPHEAVAEVAS